MKTVYKYITLTSYLATFFISSYARFDVRDVREILSDQQVQNSIVQLLQRIGLAEDPNIPSVRKKAIETIDHIIYDATKNLREQVRAGKLTSGEAIHQIVMSISKTGVEIMWQCMPIVATVAGIFVASYGAKRGLDVLKEWYIARINTPALLKETIQPRAITKTLNDLYYTGNTNNQIQQIIQTAKKVVQSRSRGKFENIMLWGYPGTGKTALVEIIAKEAGMTLFKTTGGDFAKLRGKDLQQIDQIFKKAHNNGKPVLFFIDEMENLFKARSSNSSEESQQILSKLLAEFSSPSSKIMLIGATNRPQDIDEALHRRMPVQIEVGLPNIEGRIAILTIYKRLLFDQDTKYTKSQQITINNVFNESQLRSMAEDIGDIAPAELENIMITIKNRSLLFPNEMPSKSLIQGVISEKLTALKIRKEGFVRNFNATQG